MLFFAKEEKFKTIVGGTLIFFYTCRFRPSIYCLPPKISGISRTQNIFEIEATQINIHILYLYLKKTLKRIEMTPKYSLILTNHTLKYPKNLHIPKNINFFDPPPQKKKKKKQQQKTEKNKNKRTEFHNLKPSLLKYEYIKVPPPHLCVNLCTYLTVVSLEQVNKKIHTLRKL